MALIDAQGGSGTKTTTGEVTDEGPIQTVSYDDPREPFLDSTEDRFGRDFGDGSNNWIDGFIETVQGEGKNDVAGLFDAAALNFDEGVGGLVSLVDQQPGDTAGPGDTPIMEQETTPEVQKAIDDTQSVVDDTLEITFTAVDDATDTAGDAVTDSLLSGPGLAVGIFFLIVVFVYGAGSNAV